MRIKKWLKTMTVALGLSLAVLPAYAGYDLSAVTGVSEGNLAGTVNLTGAGNIINWDKFNIGSGSALNFVNSESKWAVLNRVTGGSISNLDGSLTASTGGTVFLVNPAGIVFGNGFATNANTFVASTLKLSDDAFNNYLNGAGTLAFTNDSSGSITVNGMSASNSFVTLVGNSITVAPGVSVSAEDLSLVAGNNVTFKNNVVAYNTPSKGFTELISYTSNVNNAVTIGGEAGGTTNINTKYGLGVVGGKVDINNAKIINTREIYIAAVNEKGDMGNAISATTDNAINIKSLNAESDQVMVVAGGSVDIDSLNADVKKGEIKILVGQEYSESDIKNADTSNTISIKNSELKTNTTGNNLYHVRVLGGNINLENTTINTDEAYLGAGENVSVVKEDGDYWFDMKNSLTTKAGNNIVIDSSSSINTNGELALVANAVNNQGTLSAEDGVNIYAVDGWKYDAANDTLYMTTSKNNVITNNGTVKDNSSDWGSSFFGDSLTGTGEIQSGNRMTYLTAPNNVSVKRTHVLITNCPYVKINQSI